MEFDGTESNREISPCPKPKKRAAKCRFVKEFPLDYIEEP